MSQPRTSPRNLAIASTLSSRATPNPKLERFHRCAGKTSRWRTTRTSADRISNVNRVDRLTNPLDRVGFAIENVCVGRIRDERQPSRKVGARCTWTAKFRQTRDLGQSCRDACLLRGGDELDPVLEILDRVAVPFAQWCLAEIPVNARCHLQQRASGIAAGVLIAPADRCGKIFAAHRRRDAQIRIPPQRPRLVGLALTIVVTMSTSTEQNRLDFANKKLKRGIINVDR